MTFQTPVPAPIALTRNEHPTVHEVVVGDRKLPVLRERHTILSRFRDAAIRAGDRTLLRTLFRPTGAKRIADPSTTLVAHQTGAPPVLHFQMADGRCFRIAMRQEKNRVLFSLGRHDGREPTWTDYRGLSELKDGIALDGPFFRELLATQDHPAAAQPRI